MRHPSTQFTRGLTALTVGFAALACGDATGVDPEDLTGTWRTTSAITTNPADSSETVDLTAMGLSFTFVIEASGRIETILELQGVVDSNTGTLAVQDGRFTIFIDESMSTGTISRRDETLTVNFLTGIEWDFGSDGFDEPATLLLTLQRDAESSNQ